MITVRRLTSGGLIWVLSVHLFSAALVILWDILEFELFLFMFAKGELQSVLKIVTREHTLETIMSKFPKTEVLVSTIKEPGMESRSRGRPLMEGTEEWGDVLSQSQSPASPYVVWNIPPPYTFQFRLALVQGMAKTHFLGPLKYGSLKVLS